MKTAIRFVVLGGRKWERSKAYHCTYFYRHHYICVCIYMYLLPNCGLKKDIYCTATFLKGKEKSQNITHTLGVFEGKNTQVVVCLSSQLSLEELD